MAGRKGRKLLVATIGLATVAYVACSSDDERSTAGNLVLGPTGGSSSTGGVPQDAPSDAPFIDVIANLIAPPMDASED